MLPIRIILHPTDFSEHSQHALAMACSLAQDFGAQLFLVHLAEPSSPLQASSLQGSGAWESGTISQDGHSHRLAANHQVRILRLTQTGNPAARILDVARSVHANLIVLGDDGDSGSERPLVGNVAEQILRDTTFPLLIVRTPWETRQPAAMTPKLEPMRAT